MAAVITSIQHGTISFTIAQTSRTATITSVDTTKAFVILRGVDSNYGTNDWQGATFRIALTSATVVTATRATSDGTTAVVHFTVVEFGGGINSIQSGTISVLSALSSNTATISAVGSTAFIIFQGCSGTSNEFAERQCAVELTNSTTVTAYTSVGSDAMTIGYTVVDATSELVESVQQASHSQGSTASTTTDLTITSVDTNRTILMPGGVRVTAAPVVVAFSPNSWQMTLTSATNIQWQRSATTTGNTWEYKTSVVQFAASVVASNVQRGSIALAAATSNTATITSVDTAKSLIFPAMAFGTVVATGERSSWVVLTDATTVTAAVNTSTTFAGIGWQVIEFDDAFPMLEIFFPPPYGVVPNGKRPTPRPQWFFVDNLPNPPPPPPGPYGTGIAAQTNTVYIVRIPQINGY